MPSIIETLKNITYTNLEQFVEDLNANFAIIQNSPLYKGVPGKPAQAIQGLRGIRGNQFLFVNYQNFNLQFPGDLTNASQININYLNSKLSQFENKQKLLSALGVIELVNNDVIVLTNSIMLSYSDSTNTFVDTLLAFNQQANLISSIETQIENYVQLYVSQNQTIQNLVNIFESYDSYAKNVPDNDNGNLSNIQTTSSIFAPYVLGTDNINGIKQTNHKYFGFADNLFPETNNGTLVIGSMRKYTEMLMETISLISVQPLSSDYAPGINNIPSIVFLQDSENNGIMFGLKSKLNLSTFGSIYKDSAGNIVIKSDAGVLDSEFSKLLINRTNLSYSKPVFFGNNLQVGNDLAIIGNINHTFLRTGSYIASNTNPKLIEVGYLSGNVHDGIWKNISDLVQLTTYNSKVLITDVDGNITKIHELSPGILINDISELTNISVPLPSIQVNDYNNILTSAALNVIITKLNNICYAILNGEIADLTLTDKLTTQHIQFSTGFASKILATDTNGNIINTYSAESETMVTGDETDLNPITVVPNSSGSIVTSNYLGFVITKLNNICNYIENNYYKKSDFGSGIEDNIIFGGNVTLVNSTQQYWSYKIVGTNYDGKLIPLDNYISSDSNDSYYNQIPADTTSTLGPNTTGPIITNASGPSVHARDVNVKSIINGAQWGWLISILNNIKTRFLNTFNKTETVNAIYSQLPTGSIILWSLLGANGQMPTSGNPTSGNPTSGNPAPDIPGGWIKCDGSTIPTGYTTLITTQTTTPNLAPFFASANLVPIVKMRLITNYNTYEVSQTDSIIQL